jgi:hypothetical protein
MGTDSQEVVGAFVARQEEGDMEGDEIRYIDLTSIVGLGNVGDIIGVRCDGETCTVYKKTNGEWVKVGAFQTPPEQIMGR